MRAREPSISAARLSEPEESLGRGPFQQADLYTIRVKMYMATATRRHPRVCRIDSPLWTISCGPRSICGITVGQQRRFGFAIHSPDPYDSSSQHLLFSPDKARSHQGGLQVCRLYNCNTSAVSIRPSQLRAWDPAFISRYGYYG